MLVHLSIASNSGVSELRLLQGIAGKVTAM